MNHKRTRAHRCRRVCSQGQAAELDGNGHKAHSLHERRARLGEREQRADPGGDQVAGGDYETYRDPA